MRIAIVTDYSLDLIGGAQRAALNEAAVLVGAGHGVLIVGPRPVRPLAIDGVAVCWTSGRRLPFVDFPLVADDVPLRELLLRAFARERIDAVHLHSEFGHAGAARFAARALGLPVVHTVHTAYWPAVPAPLVPAARTLLAHLAGPVPRRTTNPLLDHTIEAACRADVVVSPSAHQAADLTELGAPTPILLPNCDGEPPRTPAPLPGVDHLRVAWIGRCVPEKRLLTFLGAVADAQRRLPRGALKVAVAGDGLLLRPARLLHGATPGLVLLGRLDRPSVGRLIDASHVTALTSQGFDNQPMTVVESVRAGRGVLHTDPRLAEGMDPDLLTNTPDRTGIADLLVELALDPDRAAASADRARAAAGQFSSERHLAGLLPLLAQSDRPRTVPAGTVLQLHGSGPTS